MRGSRCCLALVALVAMTGLSNTEAPSTLFEPCYWWCGSDASDGLVQSVTSRVCCACCDARPGAQTARPSHTITADASSTSNHKAQPTSTTDTDARKKSSQAIKAKQAHTPHPKGWNTGGHVVRVAGARVTPPSLVQVMRALRLLYCGRQSRSLHTAHGNGDCCAGASKGQDTTQGPSNEHFDTKPLSFAFAAKLVPNQIGSQINTVPARSAVWTRPQVGQGGRGQELIA